MTLALDFASESGYLFLYFSRGKCLGGMGIVVEVKGGGGGTGKYYQCEPGGVTRD